MTVARVFHPSHLWRNENLRGVSVQIIVLAAVFAAAAWLLGNVATNYAALDKTFGFGFLQLPANYDINQSLIDYSSRDTHLRAALVGLINTLLVAVAGLVLATLLGLAVGVMRLSGNWLVAKIAYVYIELTRNTPVLLLILLWHGILINTLPHPREALSLGGSVFLSNRGVYMPCPVFQDGSWTLLAALVAALAAIWFLRRRSSKSMAESGRPKPWRLPGIGLTIALVTAAYFFAGQPVTLDVPALRGFNYAGGVTLLPEFVALAGALGFYTSGFIAEIVRAGIQSVDRGQTEAARALGLSEGRVMSLIILPQALRVIVPPLTSEYLSLTKNSSLAIAIGYMDLMATLGGITLNQTGREMEAMILVLLVYLTISLALSAFMNWYNTHVRIRER